MKSFNKNTLVIRPRKWEMYLIVAIIVLLCIALMRIDESFIKWFFRIKAFLFVAIIIGVYKIVKPIWMDYTLFDKSSQTCFIQERKVKVPFDEIDTVTTWKEEHDGYDLYLVGLQLKNNDRIEIYETGNLKRAERIAKHVSKFIDKEINHSE